MHVVIIGSGPAGITAMERLYELNPACKITLVSKDPQPYSLCALPYYLAGMITHEQTIFAKKPELEKLHANLLFGTRATGIDTRKKFVFLDNDSKLGFDILLLATGSLPIVPKIPGIRSNGVFFLNSVSDCEKIRSQIKRCAVRRAVVLGGGFTGIETAVALKMLGLSVAVVEQENRLLPKLLDHDMANAVNALLERNGITLFLGSRATEICADNDNNVRGIKIDTKKSAVRCELVVISIGVRPNMEVVKNTDIKTGNGIIVNKKMMTSNPSVYAAGDVAELFDPVTGRLQLSAVWLNAVLQGMVAGTNIAGREANYEPILNMNVLTVFDTTILGLGTAPGQSTEEMKKLVVAHRNAKKKLFLSADDKRVCGLQSVGTVPCRGLITLIQEKLYPETIASLKDHFFHPRLRNKVLHSVS